MAPIKVNVRKRSVAVLFGFAILIPALLAIVAYFNIADMSSVSRNLFAFLVGTFTLSEIGIIGVLTMKKLRKDSLRVFGVVVATIVLIIAALDVLGMTFALFNPIAGIAVTLALVYAVWEGFRN